MFFDALLYLMKIKGIDFLISGTNVDIGTALNSKFSTEIIEEVCVWLTKLRKLRPMISYPIKKEEPTFRVYSLDENLRFSQGAKAKILALEKDGMLSLVLRENIIQLLMEFKIKITVGVLDFVVLVLFFKTPWEKHILEKFIVQSTEIKQ